MADEQPRAKLVFKLSTLAAEIALEFKGNTSAAVVRALFALAESVRLRRQVVLTMNGEPGASRPVDEPNGGGDLAASAEPGGSAGGVRDDQTGDREQGSAAGSDSAGPAVADDEPVRCEHGRLPGKCMRCDLAAAERDRDTLRAALAITPENIDAIARVIFEADHIHSDGGHGRWDRLADDYLDLLRVDARAVLEAIAARAAAPPSKETP